MKPTERILQITSGSLALVLGVVLIAQGVFAILRGARSKDLMH